MGRSDKIVIAINVLHKFLIKLGIHKILILYRQLRGYQKLPILMYHSIDQSSNSIFSVSPDVFKRQMQFLSSNCDVVRLTALADQFKKKSKFSTKPRVAITFDDAEKVIYSKVHPVMITYNLPYTVFVPTSFLGKKTSWMRKPVDVMSKDELIELHQSGIVDFGSHTVDHLNMATLDTSEAERQLIKSREILASILGVEEINMFAYPYGGYPHFSKQTTKILKKLGYKIGLTTVTGVMHSPQKLLTLPRIIVEENDDEKIIFSKLNGEYDWLAIKENIVHRIRKLFRINKKDISALN